MVNRQIKVCYVFCYKDPEYTRNISLISALNTLDSVRLQTVRNKRKGLTRYVYVPIKLLLVRLWFNPDVFVVGFRAHEIFWAFYPSMIGKKIIFDEFIDPHDWLLNEHGKIRGASKVFIGLIDFYMRTIMALSTYILTDTKAHSRLCIENYKVPSRKVKTIPVGANEKEFTGPAIGSKVKDPQYFDVLYYGSMLPLHGVDVVLEAISYISQKTIDKRIRLTLIGGKKNKAFNSLLNRYIEDHNVRDHIVYIPWVGLSELPEYIASADLCLGGPFGNTGQAKRVVTGKTYQLLCMGKPVVIGRITNGELFKDKNNCLLVKQGSPKSLASAIEWAVLNRKQLSGIGHKGRILFENEFSKEQIGKKLEPLLK